MLIFLDGESHTIIFYFNIESLESRYKYSHLSIERKKKESFTSEISVFNRLKTRNDSVDRVKAIELVFLYSSKNLASPSPPKNLAFSYVGSYLRLLSLLLLT